MSNVTIDGQVLRHWGVMVLVFGSLVCISGVAGSIDAASVRGSYLPWSETVAYLGVAIAAGGSFVLAWSYLRTAELT